MKTSRSWTPVAIAGAVLGIFVVAALISRHFFERSAAERRARPSPPSPETTDAQEATSRFRVAEVDGAVETFQNGQWYVVRAGDFLSLRDVVRTQRGARVLLRRGSTEVEVPENMDLRLDSIARQTASFGVLRGGRVQANVRAANETVEITAQQTRASNDGIARFVVSVGKSGRVSVAALEGAARFAGKKREVRVTAGTESTAPPAGEPGDPEAIPEELILSVVWPDEPPGRAAELRGKVSPSSRVTVNGQEAETDDAGRFTTSVPLQVGKNQVKVEAHDIAGRQRSVSREVRRESRAPTLQPVGEDLWKR